MPMLSLRSAKLIADRHVSISVQQGQSGLQWTGNLGGTTGRGGTGPRPNLQPSGWGSSSQIAFDSSVAGGATWAIAAGLPGVGLCVVIAHLTGLTVPADSVPGIDTRDHVKLINNTRSGRIR